MNQITIPLILVSLFLGTKAQSAELSFVGDDFHQQEMTSVQSLTCGSLGEALRDFSVSQNRVNSSVMRYHNDVAFTVRSWSQQLRRLEGRTVRIASGAFNNVHRSASVSRDNALIFQERISRQNERLFQLVAKANECF